jgi:transposase
VPSLLRGKEVSDIEELKRQGLSTQAIGRFTRFDRKTVRKYLLKPEETPVYGPRSARPSKLTRSSLSIEASKIRRGEGPAYLRVMTSA